MILITHQPSTTRVNSYYFNNCNTARYLVISNILAAQKFKSGITFYDHMSEVYFIIATQKYYYFSLLFTTYSAILIFVTHRNGNTIVVENESAVHASKLGS